MLRFDSVSLDARLYDISLSLDAGQWWTLLGPNGAGKSTLLSLAAGLEKASSGEVSIGGRPLSQIDIGHLSEYRCLASQFYRSEFNISVRESFLFFNGFCDIPGLIESHLEVACLLDKVVESLSGGEKQRVHLARNLMQLWPRIELGKALILLDEPLQQMDVSFQAKALELISKLHQLGNTIVMSHHDINQAVQHSTHICLIKDGRIFDDGDTHAVVTLDKLQTLYSHTFQLVKNEHNNRAYFISD